MTQFWPPPPETDSGWLTLTLTASWVAYGSGYGTPRYRRIGKRVTLAGLIKSGTTTPGTVIATLPAGYQPSSRELYAVHNGAASHSIQVDTNGQLALASGVTSAELGLAGISFLVD